MSVRLDQDRPSELEGYLVGLGKKISTRLTVINRDGVVLADSERDPAVMESHRFRPEVYQALEERPPTPSGTPTQPPGHALSGAAAPEGRRGRGRPEAEPVCEGYRRPAPRDSEKHGRGGGIILALSLLAPSFFRGRLALPMREIVQASRRVAAGDFEVQVRPRIADEWQELAGASTS